MDILIESKQLLSITIKSEKNLLRTFSMRNFESCGNIDVYQFYKDICFYQKKNSMKLLHLVVLGEDERWKEYKRGLQTVEGWFKIDVYYFYTLNMLL